VPRSTKRRADAFCWQRTRSSSRWAIGDSGERERLRRRVLTLVCAASSEEFIDDSHALRRYTLEVSPYRAAAYVEPDPSLVEPPELELDEIPPAAMRIETHAPIVFDARFALRLALALGMVGVTVSRSSSQRSGSDARNCAESFVRSRRARFAMHGSPGMPTIRWENWTPERLASCW